MAVSILTIIIIRDSELEPRIFCFISMIVDDIQHNTNVMLVQTLYHLFEFFDTYFRIMWVSGIFSFRDIIVFRIVSPIILRTFFIIIKIKYGQKMYIIYSQLRYIINPRRKFS